MYEMNLETMCGISLIYVKVFMENNGKMKCEVQNEEINLQFSPLGAIDHNNRCNCFIMISPLIRDDTEYNR